MDEDVPYHAPCQQQGHGIGKPALDLMALVPGLRAIEVDADCCGVAGTYGLKREKYDIAMEVGALAVRPDRAPRAPTLSVCDSETCRWQIAAGDRRAVGAPGRDARTGRTGWADPVSAPWSASSSSRTAHGSPRAWSSWRARWAATTSPIEAAGGLDEPGDPIGTDAVRVMAAVEQVARRRTACSC